MKSMFLAMFLAILALLCSNHTNLAVPVLIEDIERPTVETPLTSPNTENEEPRHEFLVELHRCLKARDERSDLQALGCIPNVFSTTEDIPVPSYSNTILSFIAINSSIDSRDLSFTIDLTEDNDLIRINSVHLRLYKKKISEEKLESLSCFRSESGPMELSLDIFADSPSGHNTADQVAHASSNHTSRQTLTVSYEELIKENWLDIRLDTGNMRIRPDVETIVNMTIGMRNCDHVTFEDIGMDMEIGKEPVLIMFANERVELVVERLLNQSLQHRGNRTRRQVEGGSGGTLSNPATDFSEHCRLVKYELPYKQISDHILMKGSFEFNYCSGHCVYPWPEHDKNNIFFHPVFLAIFQVIEKSGNSTSETNVTPPPCCVPVEYTPITLLIRESQWNEKTIIVEDMTAKKCACR